MKTTLKAFSWLALCMAPASAFAAGDVTRLPVHFARGASSVSLPGRFNGYDTVEYTLSARAGQEMAVHVAGSDNANFNVYPPTDDLQRTAAIGRGYVGADWHDRLPVTGVYTVQVYQMRATARRGESVSYTISIGIDSVIHDHATSPDQTRFDASGFLPCAQYRGQPTRQCGFKVARGTAGSAHVVVSLLDGATRTIVFEHGKPRRSDLGGSHARFSYTQEADLFLVRAGDERYEIPEVVVTGD